MKIFNIVFALIFLSFVYVQFNDPDPILWIAIYGSMVVMCTLAIFKRYPRPAYIVLILLFAGYSIRYIPSVLVWFRQEHLSDLFDEVAKMEHLYIEESREFLGLMICVFVLAFNFIRSRKLVKSQIISKD
ncbi:MAG: transmembrane 220 family protein [Chryseolinea sp.]